MSFEVEIELSKKNYFDFYFFDYVVNIKSCIGGLFLLILLIIPQIYFIILGAPFFSYILFLVLLSVVIGIIVRILGLNKKANINIEEGLNKYKLFFNGNKFKDKDRFEEQEYNASAILKVANTKNYLLLFKYTRAAWILPKNQINEDQYNNIIQFLNDNNIEIKQYSWC